MLEKNDEHDFFSKGCGTALVNIVNSCNEMKIGDTEFLDVILQGM